MNEDGTPIEDIEQSTENITAANGGTTVTPEEVAEILHLKPISQVVDESDNKEESDEDKATLEAKEAEDTATAEAESKRLADEQILANTKEANKDKASITTDSTEAPKFEFEFEDATGDKFILKPGDNLEEVLKDFEPKNNGQIFAIIDKLNDLKSQKSAYDQEQATKTQEAEKNEQLAAIHSGWDKEIASLQGAKRIEVTTNGKQSERVDAVFKYMANENTRRIESGQPLLRSFEDALDKLELKESKDAAVEKAKADKDLAKKRGSMVGGSSAPATNSSPVYRTGARNIDEAARMLGLN